jgi:SNF2 family DNA or RNA helicase
MELHELCNHPFLLNSVEDRLTSPRADGTQPQDMLVNSCGKLVLLDKMLPIFCRDGHRILIYSQTVKVLDLLQRYMEVREYSYERLDGSIAQHHRQAAIDRFSREGSQQFVLLISTKAGGVGINLAAADTVIIFDSDWNPQNDLQAMARCNRIGHTQDVHIYRLITSNSYEQGMFEASCTKLGLDQVFSMFGSVLYPRHVSMWSVGRPRSKENFVLARACRPRTWRSC